jgi:hypothetical protein
VGILIRQGLRHHHAVGGINRQMQLAPDPARLRAMFRLQRLARYRSIMQRTGWHEAGWAIGNITGNLAWSGAEIVKPSARAPSVCPTLIAPSIRLV